MAENNNSIDYLKLLSEFWRRRKFILIFSISIAVITLLIALIWPKKYKSTAVILPDVDKSRLGSFGGLSDLAAMAGISMSSDVSLAKLYPTIIKSESVLKNVIYRRYKTERFADSVNLIQFWGIEKETSERSYEVALEQLTEQLSVSSDIKLNVVKLSIETSEAQLSADILNTLIKELNRFILTKRTTNASEQRKWIEARLIEVKRDLERAENALKDFREKNRIVIGSPQLMLEQERLARDVQINTTMFIELKKQYEIAKIEEIKNVPIINVLDYARPPAKHTSPREGIVIVVAGLISFVVALSYVFLDFRYKSRLEMIKDKLYLKKLKNALLKLLRR